MKANEIRERSIENLKEILFLRIETAIKNGEFEMQYSGYCPYKIITTLENSGFEVEYYSPNGFKVNWKENWKEI